MAVGAELIALGSAPEPLATAVDAVSISLNSQDAGTYGRLCRPRYGDRTFDAVLAFARRCVREIPSVTLSAVAGVPGADVEACRRLAEGLGATFREREYRA